MCSCGVPAMGLDDCKVASCGASAKLSLASAGSDGFWRCGTNNNATTRAGLFPSMA
jgi:hypothetical protein